MGVERRRPAAVLREVSGTLGEDLPDFTQELNTEAALDRRTVLPCGVSASSAGTSWRPNHLGDALEAVVAAAWLIP